ncbi:MULTISPECIES: hypothetical protein [unclassified Massilia]|uniref:hypothetical protein n=1 Tax=unclassified Massilia TaxID=2609279 RepID=UPI001781C5EB|nr:MULTISPECIES: hypothetical protein [unclassified Massilia]MBD8531681.1 hypothetical protein [Massilia sp. CFBP 13647]MBD8675125.1 hypothetical protein [Massilia sp. CFBP 13721]
MMSLAQIELRRRFCCYSWGTPQQGYRVSEGISTNADITKHDWATAIAPYCAHSSVAILAKDAGSIHGEWLDDRC